MVALPLVPLKKILGIALILRLLVQPTNAKSPFVEKEKKVAYGHLFCSKTSGFTLIELVMVILLVSLLGVFVLSRLDSLSFGDYGYAEEAHSAAHYAQQTAVTRNTAITFSVSTSAYQVCLGSSCPGSGYLTNPAKGLPWDGSLAGQGLAPQGVTWSATGAVTFNGLGATASGLNVATNPGNHPLVIEPITGHVHD